MREKISNFQQEPLIVITRKRGDRSFENFIGLVSSTSFLTSSRYLLDIYYAPVLCLVLHLYFLNCSIMRISPRNLIGRGHLCLGNLLTSPKKQLEFEEKPVTLFYHLNRISERQGKNTFPQRVGTIWASGIIFSWLRIGSSQNKASWGLVEEPSSSLSSTMALSLQQLLRSTQQTSLPSPELLLPLATNLIRL